MLESKMEGYIYGMISDILPVDEYMLHETVCHNNCMQHIQTELVRFQSWKNKHLCNNLFIFSS